MQGVTKAGDGNSGFVVAEDQTPYQAITTYNNFYEFTTSKTDVARLAEDFKTDGWRLSVEGMVHSPRQFDIDALRRVGRSRSVSIGCAASRDGRWLSLGPACRWQSC